ncbi:hypothetical protein [Thiomonas sp.]
MERTDAKAANRLRWWLAGLGAILVGGFGARYPNGFFYGLEISVVGAIWLIGAGVLALTPGELLAAFHGGSAIRTDIADPLPYPVKYLAGWSSFLAIWAGGSAFVGAEMARMAHSEPVEILVVAAYAWTAALLLILLAGWLVPAWQLRKINGQRLLVRQREDAARVARQREADAAIIRLQRMIEEQKHRQHALRTRGMIRSETPVSTQFRPWNF